MYILGAKADKIQWCLFKSCYELHAFDNQKILKISNFYNVKFYLLHQIFFVMISYFVGVMKCYLWYQILFAMWTFIYDIKFYVWY